MSRAPHPSVLLTISDCIYTFSSYQLHADYRTLHAYTLAEKKKARGEGHGFDGELKTTPHLSSLAKLVRIFLFV